MQVRFGEGYGARYRYRQIERERYSRGGWVRLAERFVCRFSNSILGI